MSPTKRSGLRRDSTSTIPAQAPSKSKKGRRGKAKEPSLSPEELLEAQKDAMIKEKGAEGNAIAQRHESLVSSPPSLRVFLGGLMKRGFAVQLHEMFHLEERTFLLDYDPEVRVHFLTQPVI